MQPAISLILPSLIFLGVLVMIIWQPKGFKIGTTAVIGAIISLLVGTVTLADVATVTSIVWDATLSFIGIIILSMLLEQIGFFEWCAIQMARLAHGNGTILFFNMLIFGALVAALFANDGAALILTPIVLAKIRRLQLDRKAIFAFLMAGGFIGDSASNPLVISNLTNIVTAGFFHIGFTTYARDMFMANMASIVASVFVLWGFFRRSIPKTFDVTLLASPQSVIKDARLFALSWWFLALLLCGYFLGDYLQLPVCVFALGGALLFLGICVYFGACDVSSAIKSAPWQVVWFSVGLYVVVYGLKNGGLTTYISDILTYFVAQGKTAAIVGTGFVSAVLSGIMNNMPTVMVMDIAIQTIHADHMQRALAYANIIGCNLGPKMTPIGSLATLLWLHVLAQKGIRISYFDYMKVGLIVTPPVLIVALLFVR